MRRLIVNADDFGFTPDVNAAIVEAHVRGILTATTLMANGEAFDDAVRLARAHPTLDVGCHLVLVQGESLFERGRPLPATLTELVQAVALRRIRIYDELRAQVLKILDAGIRPLHVDTHKHTHLLPPVLAAVARLAQEFEIPWVRQPFDLPLTSQPAPAVLRLTSRGLGFLRARFHRELTAHGRRTTDHFAGFQMTGRFHTVELTALLKTLPEGLTEFMCHPGICGDTLRGAKTRLKESRERELEALIAPETKAAINAAGIILTGYRDASPL